MRRGLLTFMAVVAASLTTILPNRAVAWGHDGHELVGKIAAKNLTNQARKAINELLEGHQFQGLSDGRLTNWADSIKSSGAYRHKFPKMFSWHFINIDVDADLATLKLTDFTKNEDSALWAIPHFQTILKDSTQPLQARQEALFFIAHFIGDIHQPLHCAERDKDKGGNLVNVLLPNEDHVTNLHKIWDTDLVAEAMGPLSLADYATRLTNTLSADKRKELQKGKVEDWILESHKLAREKAYKTVAKPDGVAPVKLSGDYVLGGAETVEEQLTKGGVRLAQFLNDTFKD